MLSRKVKLMVFLMTIVNQRIHHDLSLNQHRLIIIRRHQIMLLLSACEPFLNYAVPLLTVINIKHVSRTIHQTLIFHDQRFAKHDSLFTTISHL